MQPNMDGAGKETHLWRHLRNDLALGSPFIFIYGSHDIENRVVEYRGSRISCTYLFLSYFLSTQQVSKVVTQIRSMQSTPDISVRLVFRLSTVWLRNDRVSFHSPVALQHLTPLPPSTSPRVTK